MDRVLALHAGSRGFDSHRGHVSERFFRSNRPGYPHPVSSELENSGIRVVVGDCSVTERRRWRPPYQTGKTVHVHAPGRVAQSVGHLTRKSGVLGSIPGLATYFRFSFRFFKKGSCQLLAKVCA